MLCVTMAFSTIMTGSVSLHSSTPFVLDILPQMMRIARSDHITLFVVETWPSLVHNISTIPENTLLFHTGQFPLVNTSSSSLSTVFLILKKQREQRKSSRSSFKCSLEFFSNCSTLLSRFRESLVSLCVSFKMRHNRTQEFLCFFSSNMCCS